MLSLVHLRATRGILQVCFGTFLINKKSPCSSSLHHHAMTPRRSVSSATAAFAANNNLETPQKRRRKDTDNILPAVVTPLPALVLSSETIDCIHSSSTFQSLGVAANELRPSRTLTTGQCFHWKPVSLTVKSNGSSSKETGTTSAWGTHDATEWIGTLRCSNDESFVLAIRETPTDTLYRTLTHTKLDIPAILHNYFQLDENLSALYHEWSDSCPRLKTIAECLPGIRVIDQDPFECLISFICSSNNNIPRITKMLAALRREYGQLLLSIGDDDFYSFPSLQTLHTRANESDLRSLGLGYRAKYIMNTVQLLMDLGGESYLQELRAIRDPIIVQEKLIQFAGVGRKVADCVALFSLKQDAAIPVDVHVWNIARRDYDTERVLDSVKSMTPTTYNKVGELFRSKFASKSGWAHSVLFVVSNPQ
jgi:N-glycosylase/DNA lyase